MPGFGAVGEAERQKARLECVGPDHCTALAEEDGSEGLDGRVAVLDAVDFREEWGREDSAFGGHGFFGEDWGAE